MTGSPGRLPGRGRLRTTSIAPFDGQLPENQCKRAVVPVSLHLLAEWPSLSGWILVGILPQGGIRRPYGACVTGTSPSPSHNNKATGMHPWPFTSTAWWAQVAYMYIMMYHDMPTTDFHGLAMLYMYSGPPGQGCTQPTICMAGQSHHPYHHGGLPD